jgi:hypothetical protein
MNILEFLVRDVSYVFDDVRTFARLRLTCKLIRSLVDAANVRFTIVKVKGEFKGITEYIQVDVRGSKYHLECVITNYHYRCDSHYGYIVKDGLVYKHNYKNVVAIYQRKDGKKHGYYCTVRASYGNDHFYILDIDQYNRGERISHTTLNDSIKGYWDVYMKVIYPEGYLSHWLHDAPPIPNLNTIEIA